MEEILLNAALKEKESKKGTKYYVIECQLTPNCKKDVFLEPSEVELIKLYFSLAKQNNK